MGALGEPYVPLSELKKYVKLKTDEMTLDAVLESALLAACNHIDTETDRQYNRVEVATPRVFTPKSTRVVRVDDFWTTDDLVIEHDGYDTGTYSAWTGGYKLQPANGVKNGQIGWPYEAIRTRGYGSFVKCSESLRVTAKWGWAEVPEAIQTATLMLATEFFRVKDSTFGVAGMNDFGAVKVRNNPLIWKLLKPYAPSGLMVG